MDFRLLYDGPLASEGDRFQKHEIRRALHPQLSALWQHHPVLDRIKQTRVGDVDPSTGGFQTRFTELVNKFRKEPFRFVPLVTESLNLVCTLDILFLRREAPGSLVNNKGDTDNRIKTLFDALRYPGEPNELDGIVPQGVDETNLFFCLLEDDKLIVGYSVVTDILLKPPADRASRNHVSILLNVRVKPTIVTNENLVFA